MMSLLFGESASEEVTVSPDAATRQLAVRVGPMRVLVGVNNRRRPGRAGDAGADGTGPQRLVAPMPGKVVRVLVKPGDAVRARQPLVVVEAMKMENELRAGRDGTVAEVHAREGLSVDAGALLVVIQ
jgi:biotin carboxyl carrier protein